ncbi:MAG: 2-amino-4-hydroxy-6-hydroxymethyldihydropteridine diphosphokinase [Roseiarcus sp.]
MGDERAQKAALGLGGNLGDVAGSFVEALRRLAEAPGTKLARVSSVYRTPPWGKLDQPSFLNMAALIETKAPARALLALCLDIERAMGRRRLKRWGPRTIDIDILTYGDERIDEPDLKVPHPRLCERTFALAPLAEIAPRLCVDGREIAQWLALSDRAGIEIDPRASAAVRRALAASAGRPLRRGGGRSEAG